MKSRHELKINKRIILFSFFLCVILFGQYRKDPISMGLGDCSSTLAGGIYTVNNNPSNLAYHSGREWNVFSSNFGITNDALSKSQYDLFNNQNLESNNLKEELFELISSDGWNIYTDFTLNTPLISYARDNWAITSTTVGMGKIQIPESLFHLIFAGNELEKEHDLDFREQVLLANEFTFSIGTQLKYFMTGLSIKYIYGIYYLNWEAKKSSFFTDETALESFTQFEVYQALGGGGFALDLGISTYEKNGWRFAASVNNLIGSIQWKEKPSALSTALATLFPNALPYNAQTTVKNYILEIDDLNAQRFFSLELDSVIHGYNEDVDFFREFSTDYPMILRLGLSKNYPRVSTFYTEIFTSFTDNFFGVNQWAIAGGVEIDKMRFLPIRLGLTLGGRNKISYSTGFGFHTEMLQLDFALRLCRGFLLDSMTGAEVSVGLLFRPF